MEDLNDLHDRKRSEENFKWILKDQKQKGIKEMINIYIDLPRYNLVAITKAEIVKNLPNNVRFNDSELEKISNKVIKRIITEVNNNTSNIFIKGKE